MADLVITSLAGQTISLLLEGGRPVQLQVQEPRESGEVGGVYVGRILNIVKNIGAAFVQYDREHVGFLHLQRLEDYYFCRQAREGRATEGDELLVQLKREAVSSKSPLLTGNFSLTGRYLVLVHGDHGIFFSHKLRDQSWMSRCRALLEEYQRDRTDISYGLVVRTNAAEIAPEAVVEEVRGLEERYRELLAAAPYRTSGCCVLSPQSGYRTIIRDYRPAGAQPEEGLRVVTDLPEVFQELEGASHIADLRLYEDPLLPLYKLYRFESVLAKALNSRVWLRSGAYLVIEPTEALVVIDVNTGKSAAKKSDRKETFLAVNLEAAKEVARQLRLRNFAGIIIVDFINMEDEESRQLLMRTLGKELEADPVKTTLVDMTRLNLVEITRKRVHRPLHETVGRQLRSLLQDYIVPEK